MSDTYPRVHGSADVPATATPEYQCSQVNGRMSIRVSGSTHQAFDVYVTGSRSDIVQWALAVRAEAIKGEEGE